MHGSVLNGMQSWVGAVVFMHSQEHLQPGAEDARCWFLFSLLLHTWQRADVGSRSRGHQMGDWTGI